MTAFCTVQLHHDTWSDEVCRVKCFYNYSPLNREILSKLAITPQHINTDLPDVPDDQKTGWSWVEKSGKSMKFQHNKQQTAEISWANDR